MLKVDTKFQQFLDNHFTFIESLHEDCVNIYSSENLKLRIVRDRNGKLYMDISTFDNPQTPADWIIMSDLRSYMLDNDDYLKENEFEIVSSYFKDNYEKILHLLNTNYDEVRKALRKRGEHRANLKFGPIKSIDEINLARKQAEESLKENRKSWWKF